VVRVGDTEDTEIDDTADIAAAIAAAGAASFEGNGLSARAARSAGLSVTPSGATSFGAMNLGTKGSDLVSPDLDKDIQSAGFFSSTPFWVAGFFSKLPIERARDRSCGEVGVFAEESLTNPNPMWAVVSKQEELEFVCGTKLIDALLPDALRGRLN
jgi:hypothetical protein